MRSKRSVRFLAIISVNAERTQFCLLFENFPTKICDVMPQKPVAINMMLEHAIDLFHIICGHLGPSSVGVRSPWQVDKNCAGG